MGRRKPGTNQSGLVKTEKASSVTKAQVPTDQVALNDVDVPQTPAGSVTDLVQGAVDEGVTAADMTTQAFTQSFTTRLTGNMSVAFGQMGQVTKVLFGGVTDAFAAAADLELPSAATAVIDQGNYTAIEGAEDGGIGQG